MIVVHISPGRVEKAFVQADSDFFEDLDLAFWPLVRKHLGDLDRDLRKLTGQEEKAGDARS
jgi:hypothetical protein